MPLLHLYTALCLTLLEILVFQMSLALSLLQSIVALGCLGSIQLALQLKWHSLQQWNSYPKILMR